MESSSIRTCFVKLETITNDDDDDGLSGLTKCADDSSSNEVAVTEKRKYTRRSKLKKQESAAAKSERIERRQKQNELDDRKASEFFSMTCDLCNDGADFLSYRRLNEHFRTVHGQRYCYVYCCKKKLSRLGNLLAHMKWHIDPDSFTYAYGNLLKIYL